jgi:hypothetical protein
VDWDLINNGIFCVYTIIERCNPITSIGIRFESNDGAIIECDDSVNREGVIGILLIGGKIDNKPKRLCRCPAAHSDVEVCRTGIPV